MTKLSTFFKREEFECQCGCGFDTVDAELLDVLDTVRAHLNAPVKINSACRCTAHNKSVGGSLTSQHTKGRAADIVVKGIDPEIVYQFLNDNYANKYGIGKYDTFTHYDIRKKKARW